MSDKKQRKRERAAARREVSEQQAARKRHAKELREARLQKREEIFAVGMAKYKKRKKFHHVEEVEPQLLCILRKKAKKLLKGRALEWVQELSRFSSVWVRPVGEWSPKGKSPWTQFQSLAEHLLVQYTMPQFMYSVFEGEGNSHPTGRALFAQLGAGQSLHKLVKAGKFPVPLTKRMCHTFMQSKAKYGFVQAIRHAQVLNYGGDRRLAEAVYATRQGVVLNSKPQEDFWDHVIQWLCNQPMLDTAQVGPIFDWVAYTRNETEGFSMKGRTGTSVLRAVEEWHGQLAKERRIRAHNYKPSGFGPWYHERKVKLKGQGHYLERHCVVEILTSKELAAEGRAQKHCVYSYSWSVQRGNVSIWSYRVDGQRAVTIEVRNTDRMIVQARGSCNRRATPSEINWINQWALENDLRFSSWVTR